MARGGRTEARSRCSGARRRAGPAVAAAASLARSFEGQWRRRDADRADHARSEGRESARCLGKFAWVSGPPITTAYKTTPGNAGTSLLSLQALRSLHKLSSIAIGDGGGGQAEYVLRAANVRVARVEEETLQRHTLAGKGRSLRGPRGAASGLTPTTRTPNRSVRPITLRGPLLTVRGPSFGAFVTDPL